MFGYSLVHTLLLTHFSLRFNMLLGKIFTFGLLYMKMEMCWESKRRKLST